jgi:iron complex outermembrane receptor protein
MGVYMRRAAAVFTGLLFSLPVVSPAQQPADGALEEVVVTARKREEALHDVPVAVSAFSQAEIESAGIERPQDFIALTPNITMVQTQNQGTSFITVRGISQARNSEPSVAVLIDGVLLANPSQFNQELVDIADIQVLKGPQGALYGRNAIGGAIIIRTQEPGDELGGRLMAGYDSGPGFKVRGSVGGPLGGSETLKFQASASYYDTDGFIDNTFLGEQADPFQDLSLRGKLLWRPNENFSADFRVSTSNVETQALYFNITESVNDTSLPVRVNNRGVNERDMWSTSLKLDFETGGGTFTSITAYDHLDELLTGDQFNFLPIAESVWSLFGIPPDQAQHQWLDVDAFSQELRFSSPADQRFRWIAGAYIILTDRFISTGNVSDLGDGIVPAVKETPLPQWSFGSFDPVARQQTFLADSQDNTAYAFFGEASYDVTDRLEASFALRYDNDERENTTETPNAFIPTLIQGIAFQGQVRTETWDDLQPKFTLRFQPNDDWTLYGGYSRGFRSGGFNQTGVGFAGGFGGTGVPGIADLFDQETANTIEVGVKGRFLENRVNLGISAYSTEAKGTYYFVFDPGTSTQNLGNLAEVDYEGLEAEIQARAAEGLDLYARFGWTDSEIKASARDPADVGNQAPLVSEYTVNLGLQYRRALGGGGLSGVFRTDFQILGPTYWYPDNFTVRDPVDLLNLRLGVENDHWSFTAWMKNALDEEYNAEWSPGPQFFPNPGYTNNFVFKALPRQWGVDVVYRF